MKIGADETKGSTATPTFSRNRRGRARRDRGDHERRRNDEPQRESTPAIVAGAARAPRPPRVAGSTAQSMLPR